MLKDIELFDCNVTIGRRAARNPGCAYMPKDIVSIMDYYRIDRALVSHAMCEGNGPLPGNEILLSDTAGYDRLIPCWTLLPNFTGELSEDGISNFIDKMLNMGVKVSKIFPYYHRYHLSEWCTGELFSKLEEHRIPLLMDFGITHYSESEWKIPWNDIYEICRNHKNLPVILLRVGGNVNRKLFPLLGRFENLHLDISYYISNDGLEIICEEFGAEHLLFGTGMPVYSPAGPLSMLIYSGISAREKRAIGSENLRRLINSVIE
ncbi:MAG: amidohydrolase family protein [Thermoproteota archaeon]